MSPGLAGAISQQLERVVYVAGDHIIRQGEESEGMYFVSSGCVEVRRRASSVHHRASPVPPPRLTCPTAAPHLSGCCARALATPPSQLVGMYA